jgi:hypothetical protein
MHRESKTADGSLCRFGGPAGTPCDAMLPLDPFTTGFRGFPGTIFAGYVVPQVVTVPGVLTGVNADVLVHLVGPGGYDRAYGPFLVTLGGGTTPPPNLQLGTSPLPPPETNGCIPEPSTLPLATLSLVTLVMWPLTKQYVERG